MIFLNTYKKFYENIGSPLLDLSDNVDHHLISQIQKNVKPSASILEISCGNGSDSLYLKESGFRVTCTELNPEYVKNAKNLGLNCIQHNSKDRFPFKDKEFDLVYSRLGLHYFTEQELYDIFSELKRIGNKILITVKIVDDIKTGKVILDSDKWKEIISNFFNINTFKIKEGELYGSQSKWIEIFAESKSNKILESVNFDLDEIKEIMYGISDVEDIILNIEQIDYSTTDHYRIHLNPYKRHFKVNENIKSTIQKLNFEFKDRYEILYQYRPLYGDWVKFYVYGDDRGLRDYNTVRMDGSGKFPAPEIATMRINMWLRNG